MFRSYRVVSLVVVVGLAMFLCGCPQTPQEKPKTTTPTEKSTQGSPAGQSEQAGHASHEAHEQTGAAATDVPKGLAELSADDRAAAEKQRVCPVSGDVLGTMDKPYKVTVQGQTVFLCCPGCEQELLKNPDKYLAKMKAGESK